MSQKSDLVVSLYRAVEERNYLPGLTAFDEDLTWDMGQLQLPGHAKVYRGHHGLVTFWREWLEAWESLTFEICGVEEAGDRVIVEVDQRNLGRGSQVPVEFHYFQVFEFRGDRIAAVWVDATREGALQSTSD